ncbi:MAG: HAD-IA family hydrolase, partial [Candidatus Micrarchaeia archaeon]
TIIFDVGGVIIKYNNFTDYYAGYLAKKTGIDAKEIQRRIECKLLPLFYEAKISSREFYKGVAGAVGISERDVQWTENFAENAKINKQTIGTIRKLKPKYKIAYFSNVDFAVYVLMRKMLAPYDSLFDYKFASCVLRRAKPKAIAFRTVLNKIGIKPEEAVFIDNDPKNVEGARATGIKSVLFKDNKSLEYRLEKLVEL